MTRALPPRPFKHTRPAPPPCPLRLSSVLTSLSLALCEHPKVLTQTLAVPGTPPFTASISSGSNAPMWFPSPKSSPLHACPPQSHSECEFASSAPPFSTLGHSFDPDVLFFRLLKSLSLSPTLTTLSVLSSRPMSAPLPLSPDTMSSMSSTIHARLHPQAELTALTLLLSLPPRPPPDPLGVRPSAVAGLPLFALKFAPLGAGGVGQQEIEKLRGMPDIKAGPRTATRSSDPAELHDDCSASPDLPGNLFPSFPEGFPVGVPLERKVSLETRVAGRALRKPAGNLRETCGNRGRKGRKSLTRMSQDSSVGHSNPRHRRRQCLPDEVEHYRLLFASPEHAPLPCTRATTPIWIGLAVAR